VVAGVGRPRHHGRGSGSAQKNLWPSPESANPTFDTKRETVGISSQNGWIRPYSAFSTQPSNNPGNAVFTFATAGEVDPASFNIGAFGAGTAAGQNLCLQNVSVPAGTSFLVTVKMSINNGMSADLLPGGGTGPGVFSGFGAALYDAASACALPMVSIADPNPLAAPLPFTIR